MLLSLSVWLNLSAESFGSLVDPSNSRSRLIAQVTVALIFSWASVSFKYTLVGVFQDEKHPFLARLK